jgi:hypothetical protein
MQYSLPVNASAVDARVDEDGIDDSESIHGNYDAGVTFGIDDSIMAYGSVDTLYLDAAGPRRLPTEPMTPFGRTDQMTP